MATSIFPLLLTARDDPTANPPVSVAKETSSAAVTTNTPKPTSVVLAFDKDTDQHSMWTFRLPDNYVSGGTMVLKHSSAVNSGNVIWIVGASICTDASTDATARTFLAADTSGAVVVPATIGQTKETSIALTMTGAQAGKLITVFVGRDAGDAGDTAAGNCSIRAVQFSYTS